MIINRKRKYNLPLKFATYFSEKSISDVLEGKELESKLAECDNSGKIDLKYEHGIYAGKTFRVTIDTVVYEGEFYDYDNESFINRREELSFSQYLKMGKPRSLIVKERIKLLKF